MDYKTYRQRLEYLKELIETGRLSSPNDLTKKFDCNERTLRKMINDLRDSGIEIKYSRKNLKYYIASN
jgi:biotin operon repressor